MKIGRHAIVAVLLCHLKSARGFSNWNININVNRRSSSGTFTNTRDYADVQATTKLSLLVYPEIERLDISSLNEEMKSLARQKHKRLHEDAIEANDGQIETPSSTKCTTATYNSILNSFETLQDVDKCAKAEAILQKMKDDYKNGHKECLPDTTTYNIIMKLWASSGRRDAGENAERILRSLWEDHEHYKSNLNDAHVNASKISSPDQFSYSTVISAWARSGLGKDAAKKSEQLLEEMNAYGQAGNSKLALTTSVVNAVCNAWVKSADLEGIQAIKRAEGILEKMEILSATGKRPEIRPNTISYNTIISAYAKCGEIDCAQHILRRMEQLSSTNAECKPDTISYNSVIKVLGMSDQKDGADMSEAVLKELENMPGIQPDRTSYTSVINAFAQRGKPEKAESVLNDMVLAYLAGNDSLRPEIPAFNTICNSYAKSQHQDDADRALNLLHYMETLNKDGDYFATPDIFTYTSVLDALSKQGTKESAQRAIDLLEALEKKYDETKNSSLKPNVRTYTSVINAISRSKTNPQRAENILNKMEATNNNANADKNPQEQIEIDAFCYNAVLKAWAWSSEPDKAFRADQIFRRMLDLYSSGSHTQLKPNLTTLSSLLNACYFTKIKKTDAAARASLIDIATYSYNIFEQEKGEYEDPNGSIYRRMMMVYNKFLPEGEDLRMKETKKIFNQCCKNGHLSAFVLSQVKFQAGATTPDVEKLLGDGFFMDKKGRVRMDKKRVPKTCFENVGK